MREPWDTCARNGRDGLHLMRSMTTFNSLLGRVRQTIRCQPIVTHLEGPPISTLERHRTIQPGPSGAGLLDADMSRERERQQVARKSCAAIHRIEAGIATSFRTRSNPQLSICCAFQPEMLYSLFSAQAAQAACWTQRVRGCRCRQNAGRALPSMGSKRSSFFFPEH